MMERLPPLRSDQMTPEQNRAAAELTAGPRGGVKGPFIPLLRSPLLMDRLQKVGEYLRFNSVLEAHISEFVMLVVSRHWTQQFEWAIHHPLALKAGISPAVLQALAEGRRPNGMPEDVEIAYDLCEELFRTRGVSDATYQRALGKFGEQGLIDILGVAGYFTALSMVMNVAHSPRPANASALALAPFPM